MAIRRHYINNGSVVSTVGSMSSSATTVTVSDASSFPASFPWTAVIDAGLATAEVVLVTAAAGAVLTITRGYDGTAAQTHASAATFAHEAVQADYDESNAHVTATSAVHGITGSVVGTTDVQTLTNKTVSSPTLSGTMTGSGIINTTGNITTSGTVTATGTVTGGSFSTSGSLSAGAVSGTSFSGTSTAAFTGAVSGSSFTASGNGLVAGVLAPKSYTNEAARDAAIPAPAAGLIVYLSAPTGAGTAAGLFSYNGSSWVPDRRPRIGARASTNVAQAISATTQTTLNNNGTAAWTATEDSGGFVSAVSGTSTPIIIPAGLDGLYTVGVVYAQSATSASRLVNIILKNGSETGRLQGPNDSKVAGSIALPLAAGDTLGFQTFTNTAANANVGCQIYAYRISD